MGGDGRGPTTLTAAMLMLTVTMIVSATTAFALTGLVDEAPSSGPTVALDVDVSDDSVVITHLRGDELSVEDLELVLTGPSGTERVPFTEFVDEGGGHGSTDASANEDESGELTAGESVRFDWDRSLETVEIRIFDGETVLYKRPAGTE